MFSPPHDVPGTVPSAPLSTSPSPELSTCSGSSRGQGGAGVWAPGSTLLPPRWTASRYLSTVNEVCQVSSSSPASSPACEAGITLPSEGLRDAPSSHSQEAAVSAGSRAPGSKARAAPCPLRSCRFCSLNAGLSVLTHFPKDRSSWKTTGCQGHNSSQVPRHPSPSPPSWWRGQSIPTDQHGSARCT